VETEGARDIRYGEELKYMNESARVPAALPVKRSEHWHVTLLIGLSQLIVTTDFSIVGVALPSIGRDLAVAADLLSWVVAATSLALAGFLIPSGRAADIFGQRRCIELGAALFAAASLLCALAPSIGWLIAARAVLGFGAAILAPASLSLIHTLLPEGPIRNRALGLLGTMQGFSLAIGLLIGGAVTSAFGWRAIFLVNLPPILLIVALARRVIPVVTVRSVKHALDVPGAILVGLGPSSVLASISILNRRGWDNAPGLMMLAAATATVALFFFVERRVKAPLLPPRLFTFRNVLGGNLATLLLMGAIAGMFVLMSLLVQQRYGLTALSGGLAMMPYAVAVAFGGKVVSMGMTRATLKANALGGIALQFVAFALLCGALSSVNYVAGVMPGMIFGGIGNSIAFVALMAVATESVPRGEQGVASGALLAAQQLGVAIGVAIVLMGLYSGGFTGGFLTAGAFGLSAMLVVATATTTISRPGGTAGVSPEGREAV
jgi:MFS family permease